MIIMIEGQGLWHVFLPSRIAQSITDILHPGNHLPPLKIAPVDYRTYLKLKKAEAHVPYYNPS